MIDPNALTADLQYSGDLLYKLRDVNLNNWQLSAIENIFHEPSIINVYAPRQAGKSFLIRQLMEVIPEAHVISLTIINHEEYTNTFGAFRCHKVQDIERTRLVGFDPPVVFCDENEPDNNIFYNNIRKVITFSTSLDTEREQLSFDIDRQDSIGGTITWDNDEEFTFWNNNNLKEKEWDDKNNRT